MAATDPNAVTGITGAGRVYKPFDPANDIITDQVFVETKGLWTGDVGNLYSFYTGSELTAAQKEYYYSVYQSASNGCNTETQFVVAYGHRLGSGSESDGGTLNDTPSRAIYSQYRLLCLDPTDTTFSFKSGSGTADGDDIYVVNISRGRMGDKLDPGNWELNLAMMSASVVNPTSSFVLRLIDDSGDSDERYNFLGISSPVYNIVSGTIDGGIYSSTLESFGLVYPDLGLLVLNASRLDTAINMNTGRASNTNADNAYKLFTAISGAAAPNSARSTTYPFTARKVDVLTTQYYFVHIRNAEFNFSNNPTYVSGSQGQFKYASFERDPKTYITSVGLYNDRYELLAVAKMSQPVQKSFTDESHITVKLEY